MGAANDITNAVTAALMLVVALGLVAHLPRRPATWGVTAFGVVVVGTFGAAGPLLVLGIVEFFPTHFALGSVGAIGIFVWIFLTSWLLREQPSWSLPARFGRLLGAVALLGMVILAAGLLPPWQSTPQLIVFGLGLPLTVFAYLAIPVWFALIGWAAGQATASQVRGGTRQSGAY